jgi:hypothetical protein
MTTGGILIQITIPTLTARTFVLQELVPLVVIARQSPAKGWPAVVLRSPRAEIRA